MKHIIKLLIVIEVIMGCNQAHKNGTGNHSKISIDLNDTLTTFSQLFEEVIYIPLETNQECGLGNIHKVQTYQNVIYVSDYDANLYMFDMTGKYIKTIGGNGRGPGERKGLSDFIIDKKGEGIEVLDGALGRVTRYDLKGNYEWDKIMSFYSSFFIKRDTSTYIFNNGNIINKDSKNIYITDSQLNPIKKYNPIIAPNINYTSLFPFSFGEDEVLCTDLYDNKIYAINKQNEIKIKWEFDFGKYQIPQSIINKFDTHSKDLNSIDIQRINRGIYKQISEKYALYMQNIQINVNWVYFNYMIVNKFKVHCLMNRKTMKILLFTSEMQDDMNGLYLANLCADFIDQSMVGVTYPFLLKKCRGNQYRSIEALKNVDESHNPIVVIYKLKIDEN